MFFDEDALTSKEKTMVAMSYITEEIRIAEFVYAGFPPEWQQNYSKAKTVMDEEGNETEITKESIQFNFMNFYMSALDKQMRPNLEYF